MNETLIILSGVTIGLIIFDIWIAIEKGMQETISWSVYSIAKKYPVIPFAVGFVAGHLFWVQNCQ